MLRSGASTGDGLYLVDIDGTGPLPPRDVYCDMTTAGGGWTLVYKIRNDVADISDPWWGMVGLGSGDALPTSPIAIPLGSHFEGPAREVRWTFYRRIAGRGADLRGTMLSPAGETLLDVYGRDFNAPVGSAVTGASGVPTTICGTSGSGSTVIPAAPGVPLAEGQTVYECYLTASGRDVDTLVVYDPAPATAPILGDDSISDFGSMFADSTTVFWIREAAP